MFTAAFISPVLHSKKKKAALTIRFLHYANGRALIPVDSVYTNSLQESYTITKLRYYISNITLLHNETLHDTSNYQLIDLAGSTSFTIPVNEGKYNDISFLLGIDSLRNCSGAQEGVLDPMRDMFWTWNTGYVVLKMEGRSNVSPVKKRLEHHIGGYRFGNNVSSRVTITFPDELKIKENSNTEIVIAVDLDRYWNGVNKISIKEEPLCTLPGKQAQKIAANFPGMFSLSAIKGIGK